MRSLTTTLTCIVLSLSTVFAQSTARVSGRVLDPNGAAILGARVELKGPVTVSKTTGESGEFDLSGLPAGNYRLSVSAEGFGEKTQDITLPNTGQNIDVILPIGSPQLTVTAEIGQEVDRQDVPQGINLIGTEQIAQRANTTLAEVAEEEVGVNTQRTSPTMGGMFIRGMVGTKVNVYVDGVRYTTAAQRGGVSTFFNLSEPSGLQSVEILRGSTSAQYGSDALGGTVSLLTRNASFGDSGNVHGEINSNYGSAARTFGSSAFLSFGGDKFGGSVNLAGRRVNELRVARGIDSHSALTRFLGLPSDILGTRLPDTDFAQYGGALKLNFSPRAAEQVLFYYSRSQQDGGKRYDQLLGGDGNLIADLRNLMLDFGYLKYVKQGFAGFDTFSITASYNSQREERVNQGGQGDPRAAITHQYERTTAVGVGFFLDKEIGGRNSIVIGGDLYRESVNSPAYTFNPRTGIFVLSRPRIPDNSKYMLGGLYVQDSWQVIPERLRVSGALRYNAARYRVRAADSPIVGGSRLWGDDKVDVADVSGRIGGVVEVVDGFKISASYSRGFRVPSITDLATLGLTGDGFEVDHTAAALLNGTIGTTANASAVSTGIPVSRQRSETTNSYDLSARIRKGRFETEATVFLIDLGDAITKQSLILPAGAVGQLLGSEPIISQQPNGVVFVALSTSPVLVRANYSGARIYGLEYEAEARLTSELKFTGNYTYTRAEEDGTGLPPNIEGGTPPPTAFLSLRYDPAGKPFWFEFYSTIAARQDRLSTLDIADRRTGATRSRNQIQNFIRRGACVRGLTNNPDGICGTGDETVLLPTGESILDVQNRVLGIGVNSAPLFTSLPSYGIANLRGAFRFGEKQQIFWAFENIFDQRYRNPSWGIDGPGRSFNVGYRFKF